MGLTEKGIEGEKKVRKWLWSKGINSFQPDAISFEDNWHVLYEAKQQEVLTKKKEGCPDMPFDGHGLPPNQVKNRIKFWEDTDIRCCFVVFEEGTNIVYWQWLDELEKGDSFITKGAKIRKVYPLTSFNKETFE